MGAARRLWPGPGLPLSPFIAGATKTKGSWWPDWISWIGAQGEKMVPAKARVPGKGKLKAIEDAPG